MDFIEAAKKGDVPLIIELIDKGADINAPDKDGLHCFNVCCSV
jgi:ankyrin repeat protein